LKKWVLKIWQLEKEVLKIQQLKKGISPLFPLSAFQILPSYTETFTFVFIRQTGRSQMSGFSGNLNTKFDEVLVCGPGSSILYFQYLWSFQTNIVSKIFCQFMATLDVTSTPPSSLVENIGKKFPHFDLYFK
jgi:hypothetical protein